MPLSLSLFAFPLRKDLALTKDGFELLIARYSQTPVLLRLRNS